MSPEAKRAAAQIRKWKEDPRQFVLDQFQVTPEPWQEEGLLAFGRQDMPKLRIALQAAVGVGKSALLAWCGWNFLSCYGEPGHHPKGAVVSITADNLRDNLWPEYAKWQSRSPYLMRAFEWTKSRIYAKDHPETWFLAARSFSKTANAEEQGRTLSGLHSKYVLAQADESGDIPPPVARAAEQAMSETHCAFGRIMQAGNPTSHSGMLYAAVTKLAHLWTMIRITGDPDDPRRSERVDIDWAREQIKLYGRDNPWVCAAILGTFPPSSLNSLIGPDEVREAMNRRVDPDQYQFSQKRLGIDPARFGDDRTVIFPRQGLMAFNPVVMRKQDSLAVSARIMMAKEKWSSEMEFIDDTGGWASGIIDNLRQAGLTPQAINSSGSPIDPRYYNRRAEMWFTGMQWVKRGSLPDIPELVAELSEPTYSLRNGKLLMEPKEMVKKRLGRSPDLADALFETFALPDMPGTPNMYGIKAKSKHEMFFDPYAEDQTAYSPYGRD